MFVFKSTGKYTDLNQLYELLAYDQVHSELKKVGVMLKLLWKPFPFDQCMKKFYTGIIPGICFPGTAALHPIRCFYNHSIHIESPCRNA